MKFKDKFKQFNDKIFIDKLGLMPLLVRLYVLDYVIKSRRFNKIANAIKRFFHNIFSKKEYVETSTYRITRGAVINMNLLCLSMIFCAMDMMNKSLTLNVIWISLLTLFFISIYINFFVVSNVKFNYLIQYGDFTQIIGLNTAINLNIATYKLTDLDKQTLKLKVDISEKKWKELIDESDSFNRFLILMHPIILIPFYIIWLLIILFT